MTAKRPGTSPLDRVVDERGRLIRLPHVRLDELGPGRVDDDGISPRLFHRLIRDAVWLSGRGQHPDAGYSTEQLADAIISVFLEGFSARPGIGAAHSVEVRAKTS